MSKEFLLKLNKLFRPPAHPFNLQAEGKMSYAEWQFSNAEKTLALYGPEFDIPDIFGPSDAEKHPNYSTENLRSAARSEVPARQGITGKKAASIKILDLGCGAGGKSVFYASLGADVTALDHSEELLSEGKKLASKHGILIVDPNGSERTESSRSKPHFNCCPELNGTECLPPQGSVSFICADAANTGLPSESFDAIIASDAMEHFADPEAVLKECHRLLKPGGRLFMNFPPYGHPYGAHLSDLIGIPWVQLFFSADDMIEAYISLARQLPDGGKRINSRFSKDKDGKWQMSYINRMTLKRFNALISSFGIHPQDDHDRSSQDETEHQGKMDGQQPQQSQQACHQVKDLK